MSKIMYLKDLPKEEVVRLREEPRILDVLEKHLENK